MDFEVLRNLNEMIFQLHQLNEKNKALEERVKALEDKIEIASIGFHFPTITPIEPLEITCDSSYHKYGVCINPDCDYDDLK